MGISKLVTLSLSTGSETWVSTLTVGQQSKRAIPGRNTGTLVWLLGPCQYDQLCALLADKGRRQQHHRSGICISLDDPIEHERRSYAYCLSGKP